MVYLLITRERTCLAIEALSSVEMQNNCVLFSRCSCVNSPYLTLTLFNRGIVVTYKLLYCYIVLYRLYMQLVEERAFFVKVHY